MARYVDIDLAMQAEEQAYMSRMEKMESVAGRAMLSYQRNTLIRPMLETIALMSTQTELSQEEIDRIKRKGIWIRQGDASNLKCPFCRKQVRQPRGELYFFYMNCGADMRPTYISKPKPQKETVVIIDEFPPMDEEGDTC